MQVTIGRCPAGRADVAGLLRGYVALGDDEAAVADGASYDTSEIAPGSAVKLAGELIRLAPRCSFAAVQDGGGGLGDQVLYTPRLGRFDGETAPGAGVVLGHDRIEAILAAAAEHAWTERDTILRLHPGRPDPQPDQGLAVPARHRRGVRGCLRHPVGRPAHRDESPAGQVACVASRDRRQLLIRRCTPR
jgi:hypothetical protein